MKKVPIVRKEGPLLNDNEMKSFRDSLIMQRYRGSVKSDCNMVDSDFDCGYYEYQNLSQKLASYALKSSEYCNIAIQHIHLALEEIRSTSTNKRHSISPIQDSTAGLVSVRIPDSVQQTKGCAMRSCSGHEEEPFISQKELFAYKPRQCQTCGMCDGHDSRNCPNKYVFPPKGGKQYKSPKELWACKPRRCQTCGRCDGHDSRNCPTMYGSSKKGDEKQNKSLKEPWASKPRQCKTCGMCDGHDSRNCPTKYVFADFYFVIFYLYICHLTLTNILYLKNICIPL